MTLKAKLGKISGSRDTPSLPVTVFDSANADLTYDAALLAAVSAAQTAYPTLLGCHLKADEVTVSELSSKAITFDVPYKRPGRNILLRSASAQTKSKKLHNFIAPVGVFGVSGADETTGNPSLKWKPDRQTSQSEFNAGKPITVDPLNESRTMSFSTSQSFVTDAYIDTIEDVVDRGCFNDSTFLGRPAGSLQLVRFTANERDVAEWELGVGFGFRKTQTTIDVGDGVQIPTLRGCDYYWPVEKQVFADGQLTPKVEKVVVGRAWDLATFQDLNIPSPGILTTRTADDQGVVTSIPEGFGIEASDQVIVFWDGGSQVADVSSVGTYTLSFTNGDGDILPVVNTNVLVARYVP